MDFLLRTGLVFVHAFQFVVSLTAGLYVSLLVAVLLIAAQIHEPAAFVRQFKIGPKKVAIMGTLVWLVIGIMEFPADSAAV